MAVYVTDEELNTYRMLVKDTSNHSGDFYIYDRFLYKALREDIQDRILFLKEMPKHKHVISILDELHFEWDSDYKSGYIMEYKEDAKTFKEAYKEHYDFNKKMYFIKQIFSALEFLNQFIIVGDLHSDNFLIYQNNAFITDLEHFRKLNEKRQKFMVKYKISEQASKEQSLYSNVTKMFIESYSFLLEIDLSRLIRLFGYKRFCNLFMEFNLPKEMLEFLKTSLAMMKEKRLFKDMYIPERFITPDVLEIKKELIRKFDFL